MRIIIQKFGGTSLSTHEGRTFVIKHIQQALKQEYMLVIVVSAMGRLHDPYSTDTLIDLITKNGNSLPIREFDMLLGCGEIISGAVLCSLLNSHLIPSTILTGGQAGIHTDGLYGNARITLIEPHRINLELNKGKVVIVTGFQGQSNENELTTLGRGGSDTTATALGVSLGAERVDIFTDVDGILTADPKIVKNAKKIDTVSYLEMCNLAQAGAKVIHPRAVEIAMKANIPVYVKSTFNFNQGTLVTQMKDTRFSHPTIHDMFVTAIAHTSNLTQIHIPFPNVDAKADSHILKILAGHDINIDFINLNSHSLTFTIPSKITEKSKKLIEQEGFVPRLVYNCAKVSIVGGGINGVPGIMAIIVETLTEKNIPILQSADSNTTIWILIYESNLVESVQSLHRKFNLDL